MSLSLRLKFSSSRKRVVYFGAESVTVYHWRNGQVAQSFIFDTDETGRSHFARYLQETRNVPVYLLVDVVEEEYRQENIPHVFGTDRRAIIERKQKRLFRGTSYCHLILQGRESQGRKDDRVLFTALTNPNTLTPWLELLERYKVPLAGIYSLPILSKSLLRELSATSTNILLVSLQAASGLRQTYFRDQQLRISRLIKMPKFGTTAYAPCVMAELEKVHRYLISLRLLSREEPLEIYILAYGELLDDLRQKCVDSQTSHYHLVDVAGVGKDLGVDSVLRTPFSDTLYLHLLLGLVPGNHYASAKHTRYFTMHRARASMLMTSMLVVLGAASWSGLNFIQGLSLKHQAVQSAQSADFYEARFEMARQRLPQTVVPPADIKTAMEIVDTISRHKANPFDILSIVSQVLDRYALLHIDQVDWTVSADPNRSPGSLKTREPVRPASRTVTDSYLYYQIAEVKGRIDPFDGNYRSALALVNQFAESLRTSDGVLDVNVESLPLDVSPEARLEGATSAEVQDKEATFSLKVVLGIEDEKA